MLLADKVIGHIIPIRFFVFAIWWTRAGRAPTRLVVLPQLVAADFCAQPSNSNRDRNGRQFHTQ
jgi:hypothetical protein